MQKLIELRVQRLRISVMRPLNDERHEPRREQRNAVPVERLPVKDKPEHAVNRDREKCPRLRGPYT